MNNISALGSIVKYRDKYKSQRTKGNEGTVKRTIPSTWAEFVSLIKIQSGASIVSFNPYDYQVALDKTFDENHTTITIKSRQMGFTTYMASKAIMKASLNPAYTAIFISQTQNDASAIAYLVRNMIASIPDYVVAENDNLMVQRLKGGGTIHFRSPGPNATRGIPSVSDLFIDEAGFINDIELLYGVIKNTQSMVGDKARTMIVSTPNTLTDWYYSKLMSGDEEEITATINGMRTGDVLPIKTIVNKQSGWAKFICHWLAHPLYSSIPNFLEKCSERDGIPIAEVRRERDLSFDDNTDSVFSYKVIKEALRIPDFSRERRESVYYMGIDTASQGTDYLVVTVLEQLGLNNYQLVDMYRKQSGSIQEHTYEIAGLFDKYSPYTVSIEVNGVGQVFYEVLSNDFPSQNFNRISTTVHNKTKMISKLLYLLEARQLGLVNHKPLVQEFLAFQRKGNQFISASGRHDDIVMSMCFACDGIVGS